MSFPDTVSGKYRSICGRRLRDGSGRPRETSCQPVSASRRGMSGPVVRRTRFGTNLNSCHRLGVASGSLEVVPPGGKGACGGDRPFGQQGREQFAVQPGPGTLAATLRQMPALRDGSEAPEGRIHLPPEPVPVEDRLRDEPGFGEGGEDDHAFREVRRPRLRSPAVSNDRQGGEQALAAIDARSSRGPRRSGRGGTAGRGSAPVPRRSRCRRAGSRRSPSCRRGASPAPPGPGDRARRRSTASAIRPSMIPTGAW